jgi:excisionase family DNA binding protein
MDRERRTNTPIMDAKEAAAYLRLSPKRGYETIIKWVKEGKLRAGRAGDRYLFRPGDLEDFVFSKK